MYAWYNYLKHVDNDNQHSHTCFKKENETKSWNFRNKYKLVKKDWLKACSCMF